MARVAGVDIPNHKRVEFSLRYIHGIGPTLARKVVERAGIEGNPKISELTDEELNRVREIVDRGGLYCRRRLAPRDQPEHPPAHRHRLLPRDPPPEEPSMPRPADPDECQDQAGSP